MKALSILALAVLTACTNVFLQPDRVLRSLPDRGPGGTWQETSFASTDGTKLLGMWFPARRAASKGVIIQFHGNAENMTSHHHFVSWLAAEGYDVFCFDYRGYGGSEGKKSLPGAIADGVAALQTARSLAGASRERLIVVGQSLGGAIALAALERDGGEGVRGVILDSTFASYRGVARDRLSRVRLTWPLQVPLSWLISDRFAPARLLARRKPVPLLVVHAVGDPIVPYAQGRRLFELAPGPKEFWTLDSSGHTEVFLMRGADDRKRLLGWLDRVLPSSASVK